MADLLKDVWARSTNNASTWEPFFINGSVSGLTKTILNFVICNLSTTDVTFDLSIENPSVMSGNRLIFYQAQSLPGKSTFINNDLLATTTGDIVRIRVYDSASEDIHITCFYIEHTT